MMLLAPEQHRGEDALTTCDATICDAVEHWPEEDVLGYGMLDIDCKPVVARIDEVANSDARAQESVVLANNGGILRFVDVPVWQQPVVGPVRLQSTHRFAWH